MGKENDLQELMDTAHKQDLKILVDLVLNHMANDKLYPTLEYPHYSAQDFHQQTCIDDYNDRYQVTHGWLCDERANLPDLNTESLYFRQEAKNYLTHLLKLGADGFRIDTLKHIEPEYFEEVLDVVPPDKYIYGEVISENPDEAYIYAGIHDLNFTDYPLLGTMKTHFGIGGDLRSLIDPVSFGGALEGTKAVTFSKTHDTVDKKNPVTRKSGGWPDGMTVDQEGMIWVALWAGYKVTRWNPKTGELLKTINVDAPNVTCCTFGGENLNELYITTARKDLDPAMLEFYHKTGGLFRLKTEVRGMKAFEFKCCA